MNKTIEEYFIELEEMLVDTVNGFTKGYEVYDMEPIFCISDKRFNLMRTVAHYSNKQVLNICREICFDVCKHYVSDTYETPNYKDVDFITTIDGKKTAFFITHQYEFMPYIEDVIEDGIELVINVCLLKSKGQTPSIYKPCTLAYKEYPHKDIIEHLTIKQFFERLGSKEYDEFISFVGKYNYNAELELGMTVSSIPTKEAIDKYKVKIQNDFKSDFYTDELNKNFSDNEISEMKINFISKYNVLMGDADFTKSFISSEWYYDLQTKTDGGMEQTAIVAGYLKSVEQLICFLLLSLSDKYEFKFHTTKDVKDATGEKRMKLSLSNLKSLNITLGTLISEIDFSKHNVISNKNLKRRILDYLEEYKDDLRNAYLHRDNIYKQEDIDIIRKKTYCIFFLIVSTFSIDKELYSAEM